MSDPTYDRELIARMLDDAALSADMGDGIWRAGSIREQAELLRAADNATDPVRALAGVAEQLRRAGASLPAPEVKGTPESGVTTGLSIALALVEAALASAPPSVPVGVDGLAGLLEQIRDLLSSLPVDCLGTDTTADGQPYPIRDEVIHGITKALAQQAEAPAQEAVATVIGFDSVIWKAGANVRLGTKLYTAPQPAIPDVNAVLEHLVGRGYDCANKRTFRADLTEAMLAARPTQEPDHG